MTKDEALKLALDWFKCYADKSMSRNNAEALADEVVDALKEALALMSTTCEVQPVQKPDIYPEEAFDMGLEAVAYYATPPKREWIGLTDEEVKNLWLSVGAEPIEVRLIEAKLKEKNA